MSRESGHEQIKGKVKNLLTQLSQRIEQTDDPDKLNQLRHLLKQALDELPAETSKEFTPPPKKSMDELVKTTDRATWIDIGNACAVPYPSTNPECYYIIPDPQRLRGSRNGRLKKCYPNMEEDALRSSYQFTQAAWIRADWFDDIKTRSTDPKNLIDEFNVLVTTPGQGVAEKIQ